MQKSHQKIFQELKNRVIVTATADIDIERAKSAAKILGADSAFENYRDLLDLVDAVLIATPHDLHHEIGIASLKAGKHVLMEKPMAVSEFECFDLINVAKAANKTLMTAYPMRYHPLIVKLKSLLDEEYLGRVFHIGIFLGTIGVKLRCSYKSKSKISKNCCRITSIINDKTLSITRIHTIVTIKKYFIVYYQ